jgi:two-component system sensor histidine kinase KdpD
MIGEERRMSHGRCSEGQRASCALYLAAGISKTCQMLEDAHHLKKENVDIVIAFVETHDRAETEELIGNLERVPLRKIDYRGVTLEEMDVDGVIARRPEIAIVDELAHTNIPGSKNQKRYEDVLELLDAGISVITAVNIQHLESSMVVARTTGVRCVRQFPDSFLRR